MNVAAALAYLYGHPPTVEPTVRYDIRFYGPTRTRRGKPTTTARTFTNRVAKRRARKGYS